MMEANNRYRENDEEVIDLGRLLYHFFQGVRKYWMIGLMGTIVLAFLGYIFAKVTYVPEYQTSASVIVTDSLSTSQTTGDLTLAAQIGKSFSYIIKSDMLRNLVANDLGVQEIDSTITATAVSGTNLLTISVRDTDPQMAYDVLNSVLSNYPAIADYVLGATKIDVIQEGELPTSPINWSRTHRAVGIASVAGMGLFIVVVLFYALTCKTAGSADDVSNATGIECLSHVPDVPLKKRSQKSVERLLLVSQKHISPDFVEAFRNLANRIESSSTKEKKIYVVTSTLAGEGKTTAALNTALILSKRQKNVLLIDADVRGASLTERLDLLKVENNLETFLWGKSPWNESVYCYRKSSLYLMPTARITGSNEVMRVLSSRNLKKLLAYAKRDFDYVIVDCAPFGILADASNLISLGDEVVLVTKHDYAQISEIADTSDRILECGTPILGFVMNQVEGGISSYGYGYGYKYGDSYNYGESLE